MRPRRGRRARRPDRRGRPGRAGPAGPAGPTWPAGPAGPVAPSEPFDDDEDAVNFGSTDAGNCPFLPSARSMPAFGVRDALIPPTRVELAALEANMARPTVLAA